MKRGEPKGDFCFASVVFFLTVLPLPLLAQLQYVQGRLVATDGKAVAYANVVLKNKQSRIVSFNASDAAGNFALIIPDSLPLADLFLEVRVLGYKAVRTPVTKVSFYTISMEEEAIDLAEVEVKSPPKVKRRGDTLAYDVGTFAKSADRSIGDVLKRMPGIEVGENGEIRYNGRSISHFYIDGDDLLRDRYAIGTKSIPFGMVRQVEVLQRHQPIKVLQNKIGSDEVALNLVIKEKAKLQMTGQAKIGIGLPHQYDSELNNILFNKKYKMLNILKGNNIGQDLSADFTAFNRSAEMKAIGHADPDALLSAGTVGSPVLPKERYYFNRSASLNANNLVHTKQDWQLQSTVQVLVDKNHMDYNGMNDLYLAGDTVRYREQQRVIGQPFLADVTLAAETNKEKAYFNEELRFSYSDDRIRADMRSNEGQFGLQLKHRLADFTHHLEYVPELGNRHILRVQWDVNYVAQPEDLAIYPGVNPELLNEGNPYQATWQSVQAPKWFNNFSFGYGLMQGKIKQQYKIGVLNELQNLNTALRLEQEDGLQQAFDGSADNQLKWERHRIYAEADYAYQYKRLEIRFTVPVITQWIAYRDKQFDLDEVKHQWLFNPALKFKWWVNTADYLSMSYTHENQIGGINSIYRGVVLTNYRTLQANYADLQEKSSQDIGIRYDMERSLQLLFMYGGLDWNRSSANTIASSIVNDRIAQTILLPFPNRVSTLHAYTGLSKFVFALGATAKMKATWNASRFNQVFNDNLFPYRQVSFSLNGSLETRLWKKLSLDYDATGTWMTNRLIADETTIALPAQRVRQYDQSLRCTFTFHEKLFIRISGRHQLSLQERGLTYFFADAQVRLRLSDKWRADLELNVTNLANVKDYESYQLSTNNLWYSHYDLRGRMAMISYTLNF